MEKNKKSIIFGLIGSLSLLLIYFLILIILNSFSHAIEQFVDMWYFILILVIGFGIQIGLYSYIKMSIHEKIKGATAEVATSGGISTGSMIVCCLHHLTDILPIIGLGAATLFLVKYQTFFILIGIFSNLIGINLMLNIIQKHRLYNNKFLSKIIKLNPKRYLKYNIAFSIIILLIVLINII